MKIALLLVAVLVGIWFFKSTRRKSKDSSGSKPMARQPDKVALDMVRCHHCDLHLPRPDAIEGKQGLYCSLDHRRQSEP